MAVPWPNQKQVSSPLLDDGPPAQVQVLPLPALDADELEVAVVDVAVVVVVLVTVAREVVDEVTTDDVVDRDDEALVAELDVEREVVVVEVVLPVADPPPLADAETTVAGGGAPALVAQKPNDVDWPGPMAAFHESGVTVSVPPELPKVPLHPLLSDALPMDSVTVHDVVAAVPPFATTTFSQ